MVEPPAPWTDAWEGPAEERQRFRAMFDEDADAYDRTRPVCPPAVFDDLVELTGLGTGARVVEIGPGTGQATRPLAERGLHVLALELGPHLAARARDNLVDLPHVEVRTTSFEAWDPGSDRFDAVFCCNAFHWIDPEIRFAKSADVLVRVPTPGHLVVVTTPWVVPDHADRFWWDIQDDYEAAGIARIDPADAHPDRMRDLTPSLRASGRFGEPISRRYPFDVVFTADEYLANLATQSGNKRYAPSVRRDLFDRVRTRIESHGGTIRAHLISLLTIARAR